MSPRAARQLAPVSDPLSNCQDLRTDAMLKQAEAAMEQAKAMNRIADVGEAMVAAFGPAADAIHSLGEAQKRLCTFLVGNRLKLAASVPVVLVAVGAISPNAAHVLSAVLKAFGVQ